MKLPILFLLLSILLFGCTTVSERTAAAKAGEFLESVDSEDSSLALKLSSRPFLFEGEILVSEGLVSSLYTGLSGKGLSEAELEHYETLTPENYQPFSDTWEAETWFQNYTDDQSLLVFFDWRNSRLMVLVDRDRRTEHPILGFGEVQQ